MNLIELLLAMAIPTLTVADPHTEECRVAATSANGQPQITSVVLDLNSKNALEPAALPAGASVLMCPRRSIIPLRNDVRVLTEWHIAFGIAEDGPRALWIWSTKGRLHTTIDGGELNAAERTAVNAWLRVAQLRFDRATRPQ